MTHLLTAGHQAGARLVKGTTDGDGQLSGCREVGQLWNVAALGKRRMSGVATEVRALRTTAFLLSQDLTLRNTDLEPILGLRRMPLTHCDPTPACWDRQLWPRRLLTHASQTHGFTTGCSQYRFWRAQSPRSDGERHAPADADGINACRALRVPFGVRTERVR